MRERLPDTPGPSGFEARAAKDGAIVGTMDLGGAPEQAASDLAGKLYVDLEDDLVIAGAPRRLDGDRFRRARRARRGRGRPDRHPRPARRQARFASIWSETRSSSGAR